MTSSSIHASFLTAKDLQSVGGGLHIGRVGQPRHNVARSYMDKNKPTSMDGRPKQLPPGYSKAQVMNMSHQELNRTIGLGAGSYYGEMVFWNNHGGQTLGKIKWESVGIGTNDTATCGEVWDMRWVFPTKEQAKAFHRDMLAASRAEDGNGYLDGLNERNITEEEASSLRPGIEEIVFFGNNPMPKPTDSMGLLRAMEDASSYSQAYGTVFVVDRVVIKMYIISGFSSVLGGIPRRAMFQLANAVADVVRAWLDGTRTRWDRRVPALVSNCAYCATPADDLKTCTRCRMVSYCGRDCQLGDFKHHKLVCKEIAASRAAG
jgi:hypothetical protein